VVHLAGGDPGLLCVDLGAGNGSITDAALLRTGPIWAIEVDKRLAQRLRTRFEAEPRVTVVEADLTSAPPPSVPFVIAANPPFNLSTLLVRRWVAAEHFQSGALIVERPFAGRVSGGFGATKLSISLGAYVEMAVPFEVRPAEFNPRPRVDAAILTAARRIDAPLPWAERASYWTLVNYLFERGRHTVGEAIDQLTISGVPKAVRLLPIREITVEDAVELHHLVSAVDRCRMLLDGFESSLPASRRVALGDLIPEDSRPNQNQRSGRSSRD
jgi:16S rRNA A1518/A1519 N6-dimethyltransferase RsmA/KsgA/DIM1 with predicted DNA glycosylase/AP lyase activity